MSKQNVQIETSWLEAMYKEFDAEYFQTLISYLKQRRTEGAVIYPPGSQIFAAFDSTPLNQVKVVILGQDPYHGPGEAHGLCFSVTKGTRIPPSLRNIYIELQSDIGISTATHGDLSSWTQQGVFLLNAILTVEHKAAASHRDKGWEQFTNAVIAKISEAREHVVFILWGTFAKSKKALIDESKHLVLEAPHPAAELYAGGKAGFFGSKPFSKTNDYLKSIGTEAVNWNVD